MRFNGGDVVDSDGRIIDSKSWRHIFMVFYGTPETYPKINSFQSPVDAVKRLREIKADLEPKLICYTSADFRENADSIENIYISRWLSVSDETINRLETGSAVEEIKQAAKDELVKAWEQDPYRMHLVASGCIL